MSSQHLSDEAIAAFADGVLSGFARERATRHTAGCAECRYAVAVQREAAWALRAAPAPALPSGLLERLRGVPQTTPIRTAPSAVAEDGTAMFSVATPMAASALVPAPSARGGQPHRLRPVVSTAAALAAVGVLAASSVGHATAGHAVPARLTGGHPAGSTHVTDPGIYTFVDMPLRGGRR